MKTSTALRKARALVNKGWCKGALYREVNGKDHYCMYGAVDNVTSTIAEMNLCVDALRKQIIKQTPEKGLSPRITVAGFNDSPVVTKKDVLAIYDAAIKAAVAEEPVVELKKRGKKES